MHSERLLIELVGLAYDAAADPGLWRPFLEALGRSLKTPWCALHVHDLAHARCDAHVEIGFDPSYQAPYEQYFASRNVFFIHGRDHLRPGQVTLDEALCPQKLLLRSEFYNDWLAPQGMGRGINTTIAVSGSIVSVADFIRAAASQPFERNDIQLLEALMPHLQRAVQLHQKLTDTVP